MTGALPTATVRGYTATWDPETLRYDIARPDGEWLADAEVVDGKLSLCDESEGTARS